MPEDDKLQYVIDNFSIISHKEISEHIGWTIGKIRAIAYKKIPKELRRGKGYCDTGPFISRKYQVNDNSFSEYNLESCYWAGLMASDGCVMSKGNQFGIYLKESDRSHLEKFKDWLQFEGPMYICKNKSGLGKNKDIFYKSCGFNVTSRKIRHDLSINFGIVPAKSLILCPPVNIVNPDHVDAFIKGYIDGDGSIGLGRSNTSRMSIAGTEEMINWIKLRFGEITGTPMAKSYKKGNIYTFGGSNKICRIILSHLFSINTPQLDRKWTLQIKDIVYNFKKKKNLTDYYKIIELQYNGWNQKQIGEFLGRSKACIYWIQKQEDYILMKQKYVENIV